MKEVRLTAVALSALLLLGLNETGFTQEKPGGQRVLIGFKDGVGQQAAESRQIWVRNLGAEVHHSFHFLPLVSARLPENLVAKLKDRAEIAYVEEDIIMHAIQQETPWGVDRIDAELVWNTNTGKGVNVAILDTGIDYDHPDLASNIVGGINYAGYWWRDGSTNKLYWDDKYGHGSHCAGIVAAVNNTIGVVGVAPGASLWAVKVLGDDGIGYVSDIIQGLEWCVDNAIDIVSMSFGSVEYSESLDNACYATYAAGVLLVAAAGNENGGAVHYPGACGSVIAVSATNANNLIANFSSTGPEVELAAPGVDIKSTYWYGAYGLGSGTSMACPHVAGAAALVWAAEPSLTPEQVRLRLRQTAEDLGPVGRDNLYGYGLVNAAAAAAQAEDIHDVAVSAISAPSSVTAGDTDVIDITIQNQGTSGESFDVVLRDDTAGASIGTKSISLAAATSTTISFAWDTSGASSGSHTLTATAGPVTDETDTADNSKSTTITVDMPVEPLTDIAITAVSGPGTVMQGDVASVQVTVGNVGNQDVTSDITVFLDDDTDGIAIGTQTTGGGLPAGASTTLTCSWQTGDSTSVGDHSLTASHDLADDDASNDSKNTVITVTERPAAPIAYVNIEMTKQSLWKWWRATATVTIIDAQAARIEGATVQGHWSGVYERNVSGITGNGQVTFWTGWVQISGIATFTVDRVVKNSQEYLLWDETSDSISN
jgi:subtilisin family serine protease